MDQQQILNATITIEEVVDKEKKVVLKAHDGNRVFTYSIWKTKQDGSDTSAYSQFKTMGLRSGSAVMIGYVIDEYTTQIGGFDKKVQSKKIINFREASENFGTGTAPTNNSHGVNMAPNDAFGRRLAVHGFVNGMLAGGKTLQQVATSLRDLLKLEDAIDHALSSNQPDPNADLPVIQQDDLDISEVPF